MSSSNERVEALARAIRQRLAGQLVDEFGETERTWGDMGSTGRISHNLATHLLDSPAMRDLLAEERAKALREAAEGIRGSISYGFGMRPDGSEDPQAMAYVEGIHDAYQHVKDCADEETDR